MPGSPRPRRIIARPERYCPRRLEPHRPSPRHETHMPQSHRKTPRIHRWSEILSCIGSSGRGQLPHWRNCRSPRRFGHPGKNRSLNHTRCRNKHPPRSARWHIRCRLGKNLPSRTPQRRKHYSDPNHKCHNHRLSRCRPSRHCSLVRELRCSLQNRRYSPCRHRHTLRQDP